MKVIDAFWEKRNFGYDVIEIIVDNTDLNDIDYLINAINKVASNCSYVVIKFPVGNLQLLHALQDIGFYFMETQFVCTMDIKGYKVPSLFTKYLDSFYYEEIEKDIDKWTKVIDKIELGMFNTDRVYLDPALNNDIALKRYRNWALDLVNQKDAFLCTINIKKSKEAIGCVLYTIDGQSMHGIIGGIFKQYQKLGMGVGMLASIIHFAVKRDIKTLYSPISSNNPPVLKLHFAFGFLLKDERYVMRKMNSENLQYISDDKRIV
jgi:hypothetical protein